MITKLFKSLGHWLCCFWLLACSPMSQQTGAKIGIEAPVVRLQSYITALSQDPRRGFDWLSGRSKSFVQDVRQAALYAPANEVENMPRFLRLLIGLSRQQLTAEQLNALPLDEYYVFLLNQPVLKPVLATFSFQLSLGPLLQSSDQLISAQIKVADQNSRYSLEFRLERGQWQLHLEPLWYLTDLALDQVYASFSMSDTLLGGDILKSLLKESSLPKAYLQPLLEWPIEQASVDYFWLFYANQLRFNQILYYNAQIAVLDFLNPQMARLYQDMGLAYSLVGDNEGAIANFLQSLLLDPKLARSYQYLATELIFVGRTVEAEAYLKQAALLGSNHDETHRINAYLAFQRGDYQAAADSFRLLMQDQPGSAYGAIWLYLAQRQAGTTPADSQPVLRDYLQRFRQSKWPEPVMDLFLGELSDEGVLLLARDRNAKLDREQLCEAYFYLGFNAWLVGNKPLARDYLQAARASRVYGYVEYGFAELLLKGLN